MNIEVEHSAGIPGCWSVLDLLSPGLVSELSPPHLWLQLGSSLLFAEADQVRRRTGELGPGQARKEAKLKTLLKAYRVSDLDLGLCWFCVLKKQQL